MYEANINRTEGRNRISKIVGDFNTLLSIKQEASRQKTIKQTLDLNNTTDQMDLTYICRIAHPKAYETFSRTDHMFGH